MTIIKKQIKEKQKQVEELESEILNLARNGRYFLTEPYFSVVGTWDCKKSPCGLCCYNHYADIIHDHCVYCEQPEERK